VDGSPLDDLRHDAQRLDVVACRALPTGGGARRLLRTRQLCGGCAAWRDRVAGTSEREPGRHRHRVGMRDAQPAVAPGLSEHLHSPLSAPQPGRRAVAEYEPITAEGDKPMSTIALLG